MHFFAQPTVGPDAYVKLMIRMRILGSSRLERGPERLCCGRVQVLADMGQNHVSDALARSRLWQEMTLEVSCKTAAA